MEPTKLYVVSVRGEVREQYIVAATSEQEAREWYRNVGPKVTEVYDREVVNVTDISQGYGRG